MAKTRARKSHRPVTPILQLVAAIWSVKEKKNLPLSIKPSLRASIMWNLSGFYLPPQSFHVN